MGTYPEDISQSYLNPGKELAFLIWLSLGGGGNKARGEESGKCAARLVGRNRENPRLADSGGDNLNVSREINIGTKDSNIAASKNSDNNWIFQ